MKALSLRFAGDVTPDARAFVRGLALALPRDQLYWCETRGDEISLSGEHGIHAWGGLEGVPVKRGSDLLFPLPDSAPFRALRLRKRATPPNLFVRPELDDFAKIAAVHAARAPVEWHLKPVAIEVEITHRCNLRCTGCAIIGEVEAGYDGFATADILRVLDEAHQVGLYGCTLTGGEPFMKPEVLEAIVARSPLDVLKIQTNAKSFSSAARTEELLAPLAAAGLGARNQYVRPSINCSLGMQTEAGTPLANVAHLTAGVERLFGDRVNLVLNLLTHTQSEADALLDALDEAHRAHYGHDYPFHRTTRIGHLEYNTTPRLETSGLVSLERSTIRSRIEALPDGYVCQNFDLETATPLPKILVRADGALYPCSCFGFAASPGRINERPLRALLDQVNRDPLLARVHCGGLSDLYRFVTDRSPELKETLVPAKASICKVCKALREPGRPLFEPS